MRLFYYLKPSPIVRHSDELGGVPFGNVVADAGGDDEPFGRGNGNQGAAEATSPNVAEDPITKKNTANTTKSLLTKQ